MKYVYAIVLAVLLLTIPGGIEVMALDTAHPIENDLQSPPLAPDAGSAPCCTGIIPTFVITAVERDNYVKIMTDNFPADTTFTVTMGAMGTKGVGGIVVATTYSGTGGRFETTYSIPAALFGSHQIAVRLQSTSSPYYAYNWFYNNNANVPGNPPVIIPGYSGYPTFAITDVVEGVSVTIAGNNFTPNDSFLVRMNWMGTQGVAGAVVETVTTDANGKLSNSTYAIPGFLSASYKIAIRLESPTTNYYAYNWFYNNSTGVTPPPPPPPTGYTGYPTFAITAVQRNNTVSIVGHNFPPNSSFWVRMNWMGTQGVAGVVVETVTTDANGNLSNSSYAIPGFLANSYKIAIQLEGVNSYYYAYNWFYNNNAP